jgi:hypothetical protein
LDERFKAAEEKRLALEYEKQRKREEVEIKI